MSGGGVPAGYLRVESGRCHAVTRADLRDDAQALLVDGSLYEAAARDLAARQHQGRGIAYAIRLPISRTPVVVRHNRHGGLLAPVTRDLFVGAGRAPRELGASLRLAALGVRTPAVLMYGVRSLRLGLGRVDLVTREIEDGRDLAAYMNPATPAEERDAAWDATRELVRSLTAAGARHHDLNVKNILLSREGGQLVAAVLDVDRVVFGTPGSSALRVGNVTRLLRSARKWRDLRGAVFDERDSYFPE